MKLSVGLINSTPYWEELLNQAGVSVKMITVSDPLLHTYPVVIINDIKDDQKNIVNNYLSNGGCVIAEAATAKGTFNISYKRKKIKFIYSQADNVFNFPVFCEVGSTVKIPAGANYLKCNDDTFALLIKNAEQGTIVVLPDGFFKLIFSSRTKRKIFYSGHSEELPAEKVSQTDKNSISNILYRVLEYLFHKNNLPFIRLWQFPDGNESLFGFRIDTDFAEDDDIENLYNTLSDNKIKGTWFIETMSREKDLGIFKDFINQEIALHCYRHKTYWKKENNLRDIVQGLKLLKNNGIIPSGYASPFGHWNESLGEAIETLQFLYSSEFGYVYDSLPIHPLINGVRSKSLQVPIHPVSVGRLNIAGHNNAEMVEYYTNIINQKRNAYEPVFLYTHPSQKRLDVFDTIFKNINKLIISSCTLNDFAVWWKKREAVKWDPEMADNKILFNTEENSLSVWIHVTFKNGKNYLVQSNTNDLSKGKEIKPKQVDLCPGFTPDLFNKYSLKLFKQQIIYNYRKLKH